MKQTDLIIDKLLVLDDNGMPVAPTIRQLVNKNIKELYSRDKTRGKQKYIAECIVIYYMGDPKSPARQSGLSDSESLKMAIEQAGLPKDYFPDELVMSLIKEYYKQNITEAGMVVENIMQGMHNINLSISQMNKLINDKLSVTMTLEEIPVILQLVDNINKKASEIPSLLKKLEEAKENLMYEKETELSRGGNVVISSMDADQY